MRSNRQNPSSGSAGATYLDLEKARTALGKAARAAAREDSRIVSILLFGSLARGTATPASDADLVVILRSAARRRMDRIPELSRLLAGAPLPLDIHPYTTREWQAALDAGDPLARLVRRDGIELLD